MYNIMNQVMGFLLVYETNSIIRETWNRKMIITMMAPAQDHPIRGWGVRLEQ
jgi:hypothetical protein